MLDSRNAWGGGGFFSCTKPFLAGGPRMATRPVPLWQGPPALQSGLQCCRMGSRLLPGQSGAKHNVLQSDLAVPGAN